MRDGSGRWCSLGEGQDFVTSLVSLRVRSPRPFLARRVVRCFVTLGSGGLGVWTGQPSTILKDAMFGEVDLGDTCSVESA
jgi:hypothetical protein